MNDNFGLILWATIILLVVNILPTLPEDKEEE